MVVNIIGNFLISKGFISQEQFRMIQEEQHTVRVKLGLIAVSEGILTKEEADQINKLQSIMDKRFGDIAVEKGYLTEGQVATLLKKQGNAYLVFAQVLENQGLMSIEQLEESMIVFQKENNFTVSDIEDIKSDDIDRILPLYVPIACERYLDVAGIAVRTMIRCIDTDIYPKEACIVSVCEADSGAVQNVQGDKNICCAIAGNGDALLPIASRFARENFLQVNEDALDAVAELLNCINGIYATALSQTGMIVDLLPPEYALYLTGMKGEMLLLPVVVKGQKIDCLFALDNKIELLREEQ